MEQGALMARRRRWAKWIAAAALTAVLGFTLSSCPSYRDGMSGQLASAKEQTQSAARSAALTLQLWAQGRATGNVTTVQLHDARDHVADGLQSIAELSAKDPADLDRQVLLVQSMTATIDILNAASAAVRGLPGSRNPDALRGQLLDGAAILDRDYR
jgi:hypothetical protein